MSGSSGSGIVSGQTTLSVQSSKAMASPKVVRHESASAVMQLPSPELPDEELLEDDEDDEELDEELEDELDDDDEEELLDDEELDEELLEEDEELADWEEP